MYAESGDFERALEHQQKAIAFPEYAKRYDESGRERLELYRSKNPSPRGRPRAARDEAKRGRQTDSG